MAWSDAARAAAAEARRHHSHAKAEYKRTKPMLTIGKGGASEYDRDYLSRQLKAVRGGYAPPWYNSSIMYKQAVHSTAARNALRGYVAKHMYGGSVTASLRDINKQLRRK